MTRTRQLGAKEKARRQKCDLRFSICHEESSPSEGLKRDRCKEAVEDVNGLCEECWEDMPLAFALTEAEVEEGDGSHSR